MSAAAAFAEARRDIARELFDQTCRITPNVAPSGAGTPFTVDCHVLTVPSAGSGSGGFSGRHGGGGNQIARRFDRTFGMPIGTPIDIGDAIEWVEGGETIRVADFDHPGGNTLSLHVHGSRIAS